MWGVAGKDFGVFFCFGGFFGVKWEAIKGVLSREGKGFDLC